MRINSFFTLTGKDNDSGIVERTCRFMTNRACKPHTNSTSKAGMPYSSDEPLRHIEGTSQLSYSAAKSVSGILPLYRISTGKRSDNSAISIHHGL
jgi:hypothetical protein